ncbi:PilW family protein [Acidovorax sp.]|uniref:PilW family protein n=1 Tax=Acidovorax sp. TaxID=1872122 RepID=UPI00391F0EB1
MKYSTSRPNTQHGVTLVELLVGITIGLFTIAVAMGALMVSRVVTGSVSDVSDLQQQASHAFRVIGSQLRQTGSIRLKLSANKLDSDTSPPLVGEPVAFETDFSDGTNTFTLATDSLSGLDSPTASEYTLTTGHRNFAELVYLRADTTAPPGPESVLRNCLGEGGTPALIQSQFVLNVATNELRCAANGQEQPIVRNVANFQVRYLMQTAAGTGNPNLRYVNAATVGAPGAPGWAQVFAVEVCLVLYGTERLNLPAGSTYTDCDGATAVDLTALTEPRNQRAHMVFRNIYQLRSQGLTG